MVAATSTPLDPVPACRCPTAHVHGSLADLLNIQELRPRGQCAWHLGLLAPAATDALREAACLVADGAMRSRCRGAPRSYTLWRDAVNTGTPLVGTARTRVTPFITTVFGLPEDPRADEHIRGWVAEYIWFRLTTELAPRGPRVLRHIDGPSAHATAPGFDGIAIWEHATARLTYCLWEIKHHVAVAPVSTTLSKAYTQLSKSAEQYLAQLTGIMAAAAVPADIKEFSSRLVDLWVDHDPATGVGVAIATSESRAPTRCFTTMHRRFPSVPSGQLEGLVAAIGDFAAFTATVKDNVWTAL